MTTDYQRPTDADLVLDASTQDVDECVDAVLGLLVGKGVLDA